MISKDPSVQRYQEVRKRLESYPADSDGSRMNLEALDMPTENAVLCSGSRIDDNPETFDILNLAKDRFKGDHKAETFLEVPATRSFWGGIKSNQKLVHLSRNVNYLPGGYGLSEVALRTVDLVTGAVVDNKGPEAIRAAQKLDDNIPFRLHYIDPQGMECKQENWILS